MRTSRTLTELLKEITNNSTAHTVEGVKTQKRKRKKFYPLKGEGYVEEDKELIRPRVRKNWH
jgi:hypothetical protein